MTRWVSFCHIRSAGPIWMVLFLHSLRRYLSLVFQTVTAPLLEKRRWYGYLLLLLLLPLFLLLQLVHWLLFLVDEILFPGYRRIRIEQPLFVLGPPRSGTTHLHHVLSLDSERTTFSAWECVFGLSITARKLVGGVARIDRYVGSPMRRLLDMLETRLLANTGSIHPLSLRGPEEDFLTLMPLAQSFLLVFPFPRADWLWQTARLDSSATPPDSRRQLLRWYRRCIQKHLYVHGADRRFLSKNASFAGMSSALLEEFPDARVLCCMRDPVHVIPSQLSSLRGGLNVCGFRAVPVPLRDRLVDLLHDYYRNLGNTWQRYPDRFAVIHNRELHQNLYTSVESGLRRVGLSPSDVFLRQLAECSRQSSSYRSSHHYTLEQFGLTGSLIRTRFDPVYSVFDSGRRSEPANVSSRHRSRVMIFSDAIPERNGVGAYYCDLMEQLRAAGWQAGFAGPDETRRWQWRLGMPGDRTQQVWLPSLPAVARQVRALAPRLIIVATPGPYGMLGRWWARQLNLPLLCGFHTDFPGVTAHYPAAWLRFLAHHYFLYADRRLFRDADLVLGNSGPMLTLARERGARRTELTGTLLPGNMLQVPPTPPGRQLRKVLFAGRLAPEKNVHTLVSAARALPDLDFTIVGDGPLYEQIRQDCAELPNLHCTGWVSRDALLQHIDHSDLLVLPSQLESFGTVALEAMARQRLVLVSRGCGILDWPTLASDLFCLTEGQTVTDAIRRIAALEASERCDRALHGAQAALALNRDSLEQWESLLFQYQETRL